jgi:hypothetical protein
LTHNGFLASAKKQPTEYKIAGNQDYVVHKQWAGTMQPKSMSATASLRLNQRRWIKDNPRLVGFEIRVKLATSY